MASDYEVTVTVAVNEVGGHSGGMLTWTSDEERDRLDDLEECRLHQFLFDEGPPDVELPGTYVGWVHEPDAYSESYRSDPYTWEPLR